MSADVVLLADARPSAGLGHLARCSALAVGLRGLGLGVDPYALGAPEAVERAGVEWVAVREVADAAEPRPGGAVVLDSYVPGDHAVRSRPLAVMEDFGGERPEAALVICPAEPRSAGGRRLAGFEHACLHPCFWEDPEPPPQTNRILMTAGGGPSEQLIVHLCDEVRAAASDAEIALVRGPHAEWSPPDGVALVDAPDDLCAELRRAAIVVTAAGQSVLEAAAAGRPAVALPLSDDQVPQAERLAGLAAVVLAHPSQEGSVAEAVRRLADDHGLRQRLAVAAREAVDGGGARRVARAIAALVG